MKQLLALTIALLAFSTQSYAADKICEEIIAQAEASCDEQMCKDYLEEGQDISECVRDGDFNEGKQICVWDSEVPDLIKKHNLKNPQNKIGCDSDGSIIEAPPTATFSCKPKSGKVKIEGEVFDASVKLTIYDDEKELQIKEFKSPQHDVVFAQSIRKKESTYQFASFFNDFNAWQDLQITLPKDIVSGTKSGPFTSYLTVYNDNGDQMVPDTSLPMSCRAW